MGKLLNREMVDVKSRDTLLKEASGSVTSNDPMVGFLYDLMRDYIRPGDIERAVENNLYRDTCTFSNGWLAKYAEDIVKTLTKKPDDELDVGDTVTLISGGPIMTVYGKNPLEYTCVWFVNDELIKDWFSKGSLILVKKKEKVEIV